jgi:hypothetical protein
MSGPPGRLSSRPPIFPVRSSRDHSAYLEVTGSMEKVKSLSALHSYSGTVPQLGVVDRAKAVAKSTAKRGIDVYFALKCGLLRTFGVIDFPVPPNHCLRRTSSLTLRHYYESGVTTMMPIITAARIFGVDLDQPVSVLDFGCGVARQFLQSQSQLSAREGPRLRCAS